MKKVLSAVFALVFIFAIAQPAFVTQSYAANTEVTSIKLNTKELKWPVGKSGKLIVTLVPSNADKKTVIWKSNDPSVVSVSFDGIIIARKVGSATITCSVKSNSKIKAICKVSVYPGDGSQGVQIFYNNENKDFWLCGIAAQSDKEYIYNIIANQSHNRTGYDSLYQFGNDTLHDLKKLVTIPRHFNTIRIGLEYNNTNWTLKIRKGQYGDSFIGSEIRIYTKPKTKPISQYESADDAHSLMMNMTLYKNDIWEFTTTYRSCGWDNGFSHGSLAKTDDSTELTMVSKITLIDTKMTKAFVGALEKTGFKYAAKAGKTTPDTYTIRGNDVYINWKNLK